MRLVVRELGSCVLNSQAWSTAGVCNRDHFSSGDSDAGNALLGSRAAVLSSVCAGLANDPGGTADHGRLSPLVGAAQTRKLFGDGSWRSLPSAWLLGMLLPVCSLGVLPVLREMRRAGVTGGALLAFGLTAPLFNPISLLYGLTLSAPVVIFTFAACSLAIVTLCGLAWDRLFETGPPAGGEDLRVASGVRPYWRWSWPRRGNCGARRSCTYSSARFGAAFLSMLLPSGSLQLAAEPDDAGAPLFMAAVAIPAYATPMTAMMQLASMFQHGNSVGAAFAHTCSGIATDVR